MIARNILMFVLLVVLPDLYIYWHYFKRRKVAWWKRVLWWIPCLFFLGYIISLYDDKNFTPSDASFLYLFLFLFGVLVVSKAVFTLCSGIGLLWCRWRHKRRNWGSLIGFLFALFVIYVVIYGSTIGFRQFEVKRVDFYSEELPDSFDGYRIVLFSDVHVGSYSGGNQKILARAIDSINAQHADAICFAGDLQNVAPQEIYEYRQLLSSLRAKDGVFSVMGNHDYADYIKVEPAEEVANVQETMRLERQFGWSLLLNEHCAVHRGGDSIVFAGIENDGRNLDGKRGSLEKTLKGVNDSAFVVMLAHDPAEWRRKILPKSRAQLTLSGHTHGGQVSLFGFSPVSLAYSEFEGEYEDEGYARSIYVSKGLGGLIPFRFGCPGEIVVITLHKQ